MGKIKYLSAFERDMVAGARRTGLSVSRTVFHAQQFPCVSIMFHYPKDRVYGSLVEGLNYHRSVSVYVDAVCVCACVRVVFPHKSVTNPKDVVVTIQILVYGKRALTLHSHQATPSSSENSVIEANKST